MQVRNLTPHSIVLLMEDVNGSITGSVGFGRGAREAQFRQVAELPSEGVARAATAAEPAGSVELNGVSVPVGKTVYGEVQDLPEPVDGVKLVISLVTANAAAASGRLTDDLLVVGDTVRDAGGVIIGATGFGAVSRLAPQSSGAAERVVALLEVVDDEHYTVRVGAIYWTPKQAAMVEAVVEQTGIDPTELAHFLMFVALVDPVVMAEAVRAHNAWYSLCRKRRGQ